MEPGAEALIWISGASGGIGRALIGTRPWPRSRVIGISRRPCPGAEHLPADLADPASWGRVADSFTREMAGFDGSTVVFVHAAATLEPMGFAEEIDSAAYIASVLLNSAAPQALGQLFLRATEGFSGTRYFVALSSGAAHTVYPGWAAYGAGKAAVDQWTRAVGAEQSLRGGAVVLAVAPGVVDTEMQSQIRRAEQHEFPRRERFIGLYEAGQLAAPAEVAGRLWDLITSGVTTGSVIDLRSLPAHQD